MAVHRQDMQESNWTETQFYPCISNPPDTRIHTRRGTVWLYDDRRAVAIPAGIADLANPVNIYGHPDSPLYGSAANYIISFSNPYYYRPYVLGVRPTYSVATGVLYRLFDSPRNLEYATAAEAEAEWTGYIMEGYTDPPYYTVPVCGLIIRNDGRTGTPGAIMPIDRVNRGRSYVWPADARPLDYIP
jgi:hypothetical protein